MWSNTFLLDRSQTCDRMIQISFTPVVKQSASTIQCGEILSEGTFSNSYFIWKCVFNKTLTFILLVIIREGMVVGGHWILSTTSLIHAVCIMTTRCIYLCTLLFMAWFWCVIHFQKSLNRVTILQNRAPIFRVVKIQIKSVKKDVVPIIILSWGT